MKKRVNIIVALGICGILLLGTVPVPGARSETKAPGSPGVSTARTSANAGKAGESARALASRGKELKRSRGGRC